MANKSINGYFRKSYQDFSGGLNDFDSALVVRQNQFTELTNALINSRGLLEKSKGYSVDGSPFPDDVDSFIRMLVNYKRGTSVDKLICAALDEGNTNASYKVDLKETSGDGSYAYFGHTTGTASFTSANTAVVGVGTSWSTQLKAGDKIKASAHADAAYTEISSVTNDTNLVLVAGGYLGATSAGATYIARKVLNKDFIPQAITFNNNLIITNGSDTPLTYNNTTLNNITDAQAPKGKFIEPHKSRVFIAGTSGGPSSLFWSAVNDETTWEAEAFEIIFANDNGNICGIKSFSDSLIVLKDNGNIYQVVGSFDQDAVGEPDYIRKLDTPVNMGTIAGFSAVVHDDNKLYFLAETGVYSIDSRMYLEKVSWDVQDTVDSAVLRSGAVSSKSFLFDTSTQWDTGSYGSPAGTRVSSGGTLESVSDMYTITDATKANNLCGIRMASNGDIHFAYVGTDLRTIKHVKRAWDGTATNTDVATAPADVLDMAIDINSSGDVAIGYITTANIFYVAEKLSAGSWGSPTTVITGVGTPTGCTIKYGNLVTTNLFALTAVYDSGAAVYGFYVARRVTGTWSSSRVWNNSSGIELVGNGYATRLDIVLTPSTDNFAFSITNHPYGAVGAYQWTSGTWYYVTGVTIESGITINLNSKPKWSLNSSNERILTYSSAAALKSRNIDTSTTATINASHGNHTGTYLNSSNQWSYMHYSDAGTETFVYNNSTSVTNSTTAVYDTADYYPGRGFDSNGTAYCSIYFGANANEIIVRRIAPVGVWTGPEQSDSSLSGWGTYVVTGQVTNGNTILHEVALNTISPPSAYATITTGSLISSDATKVFSRARITFTMGSFTAAEVGSVTMNYTGTGVGALLPTGIIFDNEYYLSYGESGDTGNTAVLLFDRAKAWSIHQYPVIFMARYRGSLYGGASNTGKVYKLLQGYQYGSSAYTLTATSKEDLLGSLELEKDVSKIYVIFEIKSSGTFDFDYRINNFATSGGSDWYSTTVDQAANGLAEIPVITGSLKSIQFRVKSAGNNVEMGVIGWVVLYGYTNLR